MNILITGGGGFVGSHLAEAEILAGNDVTVIDTAPPDKIPVKIMNNGHLHYMKHDMLNPVVLGGLMEWCDMVYHFAAIADPQIYCDHPEKVLRLDLEGSQLIIKMAYEMQKKIVFSSTSEIYGKNPKVPWSEDDDRVLGSTSKNRWSYSSSKAAAEHYCHAYGTLGLKFVILRFFNFYGPRLDFIGTGRVMTCFLEKFLKGMPVEVVEPGDQTRCFTYISDGIDGIRKAAHSPEAEQGTFNIGTNREISMWELASLMKKIGKFDSEIKLIPAEKKYGKGYDDIFRRIPNCARIMSLGWEPKVSLEEGIIKTIESFKI